MAKQNTTRPTQPPKRARPAKYRRQPARNLIVSYYLPIPVVVELSKRAELDFGGNASAAVTAFLAESMNVNIEEEAPMQ